MTFSENPYDRERYLSIRGLAAEMMSANTDTAAEKILSLFANETGYMTPKVDVRGAAFDPQNRVLMVREVMDRGRWTLPGGWADVNLTPAENMIKEMVEETGFQVAPRKLAAVLDRTSQGHKPAVFSAYKLFFICDIIGGSATISHETSEIGWFAENALPDDLSTERVTPSQLQMMFRHGRDFGLPTEFD